MDFHVKNTIGDMGFVIYSTVIVNIKSKLGVKERSVTVFDISDKGSLKQNGFGRWCHVKKVVADLST